jgi:hypothetical protein
MSKHASETVLFLVLLFVSVAVTQEPGKSTVKSMICVEAMLTVCRGLKLC